MAPGMSQPHCEFCLLPAFEGQHVHAVIDHSKKRLELVLMQLVEYTLKLRGDRWPNS